MYDLGEPAAPRDIKLEKAESGNITISWQAPEYNGGYEIQKYIIMSKEIMDKNFQIVGKTNHDLFSYTIEDNIAEGKSYLVQVSIISCTCIYHV